MNSEEIKMTVQEIYDACCEGCNQLCPDQFREWNEEKKIGNNKIIQIWQM